MRPFSCMILLLFAATVLTIAQTIGGEEAAGPETPPEAKQTETPLPPTQFEVEEDLRTARQRSETFAQRLKSSETQLQQVQSIKQALATVRAADPKEINEQVLAFRKEIDDQLHTKAVNRDKLKAALAAIKVISELPDNWNIYLLRYQSAAATPQEDKEILNLVSDLKTRSTRLPSSTEQLERYRTDTLSDNVVARSGQIPQVLDRMVDNVQRKLEDEHKSLSDSADDAAKRQQKLSAKLRQVQAGAVTNLLGILPYLIGILAVFAAVAIFLVRFFPPAVQIEWVASGQVIQLLTVVTLLIIILCLAITNIIKENTIGTLLGGIGGYVLSQGIGRAAGRAAARSASPPQSIQDTATASSDVKPPNQIQNPNQ